MVSEDTAFKVSTGWTICSTRHQLGQLQEIYTTRDTDTTEPRTKIQLIQSNQERKKSHKILINQK